MNVRTKEWSNKRTNGWINERMKKWKNKWSDQGLKVIFVKHNCMQLSKKGTDQEWFHSINFNHQAKAFISSRTIESLFSWDVLAFVYLIETTIQFDVKPYWNVILPKLVRVEYFSSNFCCNRSHVWSTWSLNNIGGHNFLRRVFKFKMRHRAIQIHNI